MKNELPVKVEAIVFRLIDNEVQFLLLERVKEDGGFWQPITGTVEDGEKLEECLIREIREEAKIERTIMISNALYKFDWRKASGDVIVEYVFAVKVPINTVIRVNLREHIEYKWCNYEDALDMLFTDNNKRSLGIVNAFILHNSDVFLG